MKTPKELIEKAKKDKEGLEEDGLYPHKIGEDVSGDIIIVEIDDVITAYELMRKSCLRIIEKWSIKHFDKDSGDYYIEEEDIKKLKQQIKDEKENKNL